MSKVGLFDDEMQFFQLLLGGYFWKIGGKMVINQAGPIFVEPACMKISRDTIYFTIRCIIMVLSAVSTIIR